MALEVTRVDFKNVDEIEKRIKSIIKQIIEKYSPTDDFKVIRNPDGYTFTIIYYGTDYDVATRIYWRMLRDFEMVEKILIGDDRIE